MANYANLMADIRAVIKQNGNQEITGNLLQQSLIAMITSLGNGYIYKGIATLSTNPGTPDQNIFYIAATVGTYSNFGGLIVNDGEVAIFKYSGSWTKDSTGIASRAKVAEQGLRQELFEGSILPWAQIRTFARAIGSQGLFGQSTTDNHKVIPVYGGQVVRIKRGADNSYWAIVKSYTPPTQGGQSPDYANGESARHLSGTDVFTVTMPADAKYIVINGIYGGTNRSPSLLTIDGYDVISGLYNNLEIPDNSVTTPKIVNGAVTSDKIAEAAVNTTKIADGAVTPDKANFFVVSKNLFDYTTMLVTGVYINAVGGTAANVNWNCTTFIPITPEGENIVSNKFPAVGAGASSCFYDSNKQFISGSNFRGPTSPIPQNAAFVRFSFQNPALSPLPSEIQIEYGTESTNYVAYGKKIDQKYIPDTAPNEIILPQYLYLLSGVNNDIFYEPILRRWNPYRYDVFADTTPNARDYVKAIKRVVTLKNPTATGINLKLYDADKGDFIQAISTTFRKGTQGAGTTQIKLGIIGDSYVDGGGFTDALLNHNYVPNLKMVGTRSVNTTNYVNQRTDGRSGWALSQFSNPQTGADYFNPFVHPQGSHRCWGNTAFWSNVCGGSPSGYGLRYTHYANLCDSSGWPINPIEGDVIYDSVNSTWKECTGGVWVAVQSTSYTWKFDYAKYLSMWNIEAPDILCVMLGINDFWVASYPTEANLELWKTRMNAIKDSYLASVPTGRFVILTANTVTHPNVLHYRPLDVHQRLLTLREFVIKTWDRRQSERIYVVDTAQLIDSENAFTLIEAEPFDGYPNGYGYSNKEIYAGDGQHPRVGYTTLGYSLAAFIQYIR